MPVFSDHFIPSCDGKTQLHIRRCIPDGTPVGTVQIAHGIAEYAQRYDPFAFFLAEHGFLVAANDHLGHGESIHDESCIGFFSETDGWSAAVTDMHQLTELLRAEHPDLPFFLFGHSMGSFLARTYLIDYPKELTGAVICGTGQQASGLIRSGRAIGRAEIRRKGAKYRSQLLNQLAFGAYNRAIPNRRTDYDWLSRDPAVVDAYVADALCGFIPTAGLFTDMMDGLAYITAPSNMQKMRKDLPVFFISGDKDPVGDYGKGVWKACTGFLQAGMTDVTMKLYHDCRHEILNELCKAQVMDDILHWCRSKI